MDEAEEPVRAVIPGLPPTEEAAAAGFLPGAVAAEAEAAEFSSGLTWDELKLRAAIPELFDNSTPSLPVDPRPLDAAQQEAADFSSGKSRDELAEEAFRGEHRRNEKFRNHFEVMAICALWLTAIAVTGIGSVWLLHMVLPANRRWLSSEDLSHIQSIVTAGLLVGVIGNHFKKRLN
ncbi:hypothetical protein [Sphingomonas oligoaromativorans]|uniref:hypothetical protein n=1 Tax=Sphingomonas oligoaromativorans TaxID=575322 RepID=UPI00141E39F4|nr:hypothetical protein [Sphingomonas oligoaromativorans]NIJ34301.1 hypothetical protein [Sphingomonas oligoaromativorans]